MSVPDAVVPPDGRASGSVGRNLLRLARYVQPYWKLQLLSLLFLVAGSVSVLLVPLLVRKILDVAIPGRDIALLFELVAAMAGIHLVHVLCMLATDLFFLRVANAVVLDLRRQMHGHLLRLSLDYFSRTKSGNLLARIMGDVDAVQILTTSSFLMLLADSFAIVLLLGFMLYLSWQLTLVALATLALILVVFRIFNLRILQAARLSREAYARISEELNEGIAGAREILTFGRERMRERTVVERLRAFAGTNIRMGICSSAARLLSLLVMALGPVLIYALGGAGVIGGTLTLGTLVAFVAYVDRMYEPVQRLAYLNVQAQSAMGAVERIFAFLDTVPTVREIPGAIDPGHVRGEIELCDVTFCYGGNGAVPVLRGANLRIRPGETVAVVGVSGAGKSTIVNLVLRFFDPQEGCILLDGIDLRQIDVGALRRRMAIVPQEPFLFHASVRENLRLGKPEVADEEIERAAEQAGAAEFILRLPERYDTIVGERGAKLSGGEKQRLAIARALLRDPRIVIFDEATSSLDAESEAYVRTSMKRLMKGRTTILISHRLATVSDADRIVVLDSGRIVEEGSHRSLIALGGVYSRLYEQQVERAVAGAPAG